MFILGPLKREMVRNNMRSLGHLVAADPVRTGQARSAPQHVQRGIGALIVVVSEVGWHPTRFIALTQAMRPSVRRELFVGIRELSAALRKPMRLR